MEVAKLGTHYPIRLQLASRFSEYCASVLDDSERAKEIATKAGLWNGGGTQHQEEQYNSAGFVLLFPPII